MSESISELFSIGLSKKINHSEVTKSPFDLHRPDGFQGDKMVSRATNADSLASAPPKGYLIFTDLNSPLRSLKIDAKF